MKHQEACDIATEVANAIKEIIPPIYVSIRVERNGECHLVVRKKTVPIDHHSQLKMFEGSYKL